MDDYNITNTKRSLESDCMKELLKYRNGLLHSKQVTIKGPNISLFRREDFTFKNKQIKCRSETTRLFIESELYKFWSRLSRKKDILTNRILNEVKRRSRSSVFNSYLNREREYLSTDS